MLANFLGVLPILTSPLCALAFIMCSKSNPLGQCLLLMTVEASTLYPAMSHLTSPPLSSEPYCLTPTLQCLLFAETRVRNLLMYTDPQLCLLRAVPCRSCPLTSLCSLSPSFKVSQYNETCEKLFWERRGKMRIQSHVQKYHSETMLFK
jgi:hypothetical protein